MSSPIVDKKRSIFDRFLIHFHQRASHVKRTGKLVKALDSALKAVYPKYEELKGLDIGCGDMSISNGLQAICPNIHFHAIDIHELPPEFATVPMWVRYKSFDGEHIPFEDNTFSFGIMCDVLHHVPENLQITLVKEALRTCKILIIKDHFEYGSVSRQILRIMDFIGNYGYGISIPKKYFSPHSLRELAHSAGGNLIIVRDQIDLYSELPLINKIFRPKWQFIGVISRDANSYI